MKKILLLTLITTNAYASDLNSIIKEIEHPSKRESATPWIARPVLNSRDTLALFAGTMRIEPENAHELLARNQMERIDNRALDSAIRNQGREGLCSAFAVVAALEHGNTFDLSERHLWSTYHQYYTIKALASAQKKWITSESVWPYAESASVKEFVSVAKIKQYSQLAYFSNVYESLRQQIPVVLSVATNTSWSNPKNGIISEVGKETGGHAVKISGFMDTSKGRYLIVKNSWGKSWGDGGFGYIPESYCTKFYCTFHAILGEKK
jgi:C1A family cysteine protease